MSGTPEYRREEGRREVGVEQEGGHGEGKGGGGPERAKWWRLLREEEGDLGAREAELCGGARRRWEKGPALDR